MLLPVLLSCAVAVTQDSSQPEVALQLPVEGSPHTSESGDSAATVASLQSQIEVLREYHGHLLATVYWSLATVGGLTVVLLGFGWYVNLRVYDRDKRALIQELKGAMAEENAALKQGLEEGARKFASSVEERLRVRERQVAEAGEAAASVVHAKLAGDNRRIQQEILELRFVITEMEADSWRAKKVHSNELRALLKMVATAQSLQYDFWVSGALDRMLICFQNGARPDAQLASELLATLGRLPAEQIGAVEEIRSALKTSRA